LAGLFTFSDSPKHVALYQKFRFWPRFLTAIMEKTVVQLPVETPPSLYSTSSEPQRAACLDASREIADSIFDGLDLTHEIEATTRLNLGDTVFLRDGARIDGFAVCQTGAGTEAGSECLYVKFAAVRPGPRASLMLERLLDACERAASRRGVSTV